MEVALENQLFVEADALAHNYPIGHGGQAVRGGRDRGGGHGEHGGYGGHSWLVPLGIVNQLRYTCSSGFLFLAFLLFSNSIC